MEQVQGYGYFERFYIDFTSAPNDDGASEDYHVSMKQRLFVPTTIENPPTPVELDGAQSPFVLSLSNVEDVFTPMRTATASISFIDDIDLGELLPKDAFEWRVELTRQSDAKRIFVGYLTAEVYTQPAISGPNIVTVNAASPMTPIGALPMPIEGVGSLTIGGLIQIAIKSTIVQDVNAVYIPAIFSLKNNASISDYAELLGWQFSTGRFIRFDESDNVGQSTECDTFSTALDAVCKLLGWSLVDVGDGILYFVSPAYHGPYMAISAENLTAADIAPEIITPSFDSLADILSIDAADTVEYRQGLGSVTITPNVMDTTLSVPSLITKVRDWSFDLQESTVTTSYGEKHGAYVGKITPLSQQRVCFPRYRATVTENPDHTTFGASASWAEVTDGSENPSLDVYAEFRKIDDCALADLDGGPNAQKAWNFSETILLQDFVWYRLSYAAHWVTLVPPYEYPLVKMRGRITAVKSGALRINFALRATPQNGYCLPANYKIEGGGESFSVDYGQYLTLDDGITAISWDSLSPWPNPELTEARQSVECSLRVGDMFWNGSAWDDIEARFNIPISSAEGEWHSIESNKIITMPYEGDSGHYAEIYKPLSGEIELCLYAGLSNFGSGYPLRFEIKDLSLEYMPTLDYVDVDDADNVFHRDFSRGFTEQRDVSLLLHSRINNAEQMSLIFDNNYTAIDKVYRTTATTAQKPEQFLLDEYQRVYGRALRRWRRGMWLRELRPIDIYSLPASATSALMIAGYTKDFAENTAEAYLTEIEFPNIVKYVN